MKYLILIVAVHASACGGSSSGAPSAQPANIVVASGASVTLPNCQSVANLNLLVGNTTTTCPGFSGGPLQNVGTGCAAHVHGTLTIVSLSGQTVGTASWSYPNIVRPGEQIIFTGGQIIAPTSLQFSATPAAAWDNVGC